MKTITRIVCALATAGAVAAASAAQAKPEPVAAPAKKAAVVKLSKKAYQPQTGTRIQRTVDLSGHITDGPYQLVVISGEAMRRSGRSTIAGVLAAQGLRR